MEQKYIQRLIDLYNTGQESEADRQELEQLIESGIVSLQDIKAFDAVDQQLMEMKTPEPSKNLDARFYEMLSQEKRKREPTFLKIFFSWREVGPKLALASVALVLGLIAGYFLHSSTPPDHQVESLSRQVADLREMMILSWLEKGSTTERLKAVNLTQEMTNASVKVTNALIQTLNEDENVNVRLAALDALKPYVSDSLVREALVRAIGKQQSPLVQISLAELMVALQEKSAVKEFEKIIESGRAPAEVKKKISESIQVLI